MSLRPAKALSDSVLPWSFFFCGQSLTQWPISRQYLHLSLSASFVLEFSLATHFVGLLSNFPPLGFPLKPPRPLPLQWLVGKLLISLESSSLHPSSSASTSASTRGIQSRFVGLLGEVHFVQAFCQSDKGVVDCGRLFLLLYFLERIHV